jgi:DNA end-binding protein Ku
MPRPIWEGNLRLSLVSCPVALYNAITRTRDISFNLLHKKTNNRIRMVPHDPELGEVKRSDLVKGYEISKDHYVIMTDEEIKSVRLPSTRRIDIEKFVDAADIDRIYWDSPYYVAPADDSALDAFIVIREAMAHTKKLALGRVVLHSRERLVGIEPRGEGILLTTLRTADEIRDEKEFFDSIPDSKPSKQMLEIAEKIIEQQEAAFDPSEFKDRYEDALRALIKQKEKGETPVEAPPPSEEKVVNLMDALKRSLREGAGESKGRAERYISARERDEKGGKRSEERPAPSRRRTSTAAGKRKKAS